MAPKTLLACLVVLLASVSMIQATATTTPYYGECLKGAEYTNTLFGLGIKLDLSVGDILGVVPDLIQSVLKSVPDLVSKLLGGLLGGGTTTGGGDIYKIPAPDNFSQYMQLTVKVQIIFDKAIAIIAKEIGISYYIPGITVDVYLCILKSLSDDYDLDLPYVDNALSRKECAAKASRYLIYLKQNKPQSPYFLQLFVNLEKLLSLVVNTKIIDFTTLKTCHLLCLQIENFILTQFRYPSVDKYSASRVYHYNNCVKDLDDLDINVNLTITNSLALSLAITASQAGVTGIPRECIICLKKYS